MFGRITSLTQFYKSAPTYAPHTLRIWALHKLAPQTIPIITRNANFKVLGRLMTSPDESVNEYYHNLEKDGAFSTHILNVYKETGRLNFGQMACLSELYVITRMLKPRAVVETGVASGMSSAFILKALEDNGGNGRLYSVDLPEKVYYEDSIAVMLPSGKKIGWAIPHQYEKRWSLILGKSSDVLPSLVKRLGAVDVFLHDSEHSYSNMMREFTSVWPSLRPKGLLISDDVNRNSAFNSFSKKVGRRPYYLIGPRILPTWNYPNPQALSLIGILRKSI